MEKYSNSNNPVNDIVSRVRAGERISSEEALTLVNQAPLSLLGLLAVEIKEQKSGKNIYYNRNFHIEPTNICLFNCKFCSYRKSADSPEAWDYSTQHILDIVRGYKNSPATEVHIVGGVHPRNDLYYYVDLIRKIKEILPHVSIKAFTAVELAYMIKMASLTIQQGLALLKEAGMVAIAGGGAEIFDEGIRAQICPEKSSSDEWLYTHGEAHKLGISTNATILYGHIENWHHRLDHLERLRTAQDQTGGFNAFIPLKYRMMNNSMSHLGEVSIIEDLKMLAISRIFLDNFPHIKAYWPMFGKTTTQIALAFGADDIDGTIDDSTKIYSMAGAEDSSPAMSVEQMERIIKEASYIPVERDTFYNPIKK